MNDAILDLDTFETFADPPREAPEVDVAVRELAMKIRGWLTLETDEVEYASNA